jgi:NitT/TauT family transport system substrate-binding protein
MAQVLLPGGVEKREICVMTKLRRVLASLAVLTLSVGAGAPAFAAERVTFLIDWLPAGDKAVPYLGVQKGAFAEEGLDVVIQSGRGSSDG